MVIGEGLVGAEVGEPINNVTIVEMASEIAAGMDMAPKTFLMKHLKESAVKLKK